MLLWAAPTFAQVQPSVSDPVGIDQYDVYIMGQHNAAPHGLIDPYTGQEMELYRAAPTQFTAPFMSYLRESQGESQPGLSYNITRGVNLNYDPTTQRIDTSINLSGSEKSNFRLRVKSREVKAVYTFRWN